MCRSLILTALLLLAGCIKQEPESVIHPDEPQKQVPAVNQAAAKEEDQQRVSLRNAIECLKSDDPKVFQAGNEVFRGLQKDDPDDPVPQPVLQVLTEALMDQSSNVRFEAVEALHRYGKETVPAFIEALKHPDPKIRRDTASSLSKFGPAAKPAIPTLADLLMKDTSENVRASAAGTLRVCGKPGVARLVDAVQNGDEVTRELALSMIVQTQPPPKEAVPAMIPLLKLDDGNLRRNALTVLKNLGPDAVQAVPAVLEVAKVRGNDQVQAIEVLGSIGQDAKQAVPVMIDLLRNQNSSGEAQSRARSALSTLYKIGPADRTAAPTLAKLLKDTDPYVQLQAAKQLGHLNESAEDCVTTLASVLLKNKDGMLRMEAASELEKYGPKAKPAVWPLINLLLDDDAAYRHARINAATTLGAIGPDAKDAVPALREAATENNEAMKRAATIALKKIALMD